MFCVWKRERASLILDQAIVQEDLFTLFGIFDSRSSESSSTYA